MFAGIAVALLLGYMFFFNNKSDEGTLSSSADADLNGQSSVQQEFLPILLNVKSIKLDDSIFSDPAFQSLRDSSIVLVQDGNEGRPNPFAPIGFDNIGAAPAATTSGATSKPSTTKAPGN